MVALTAGSQHGLNTDAIGVTDIRGGTVAQATADQIVVDYGGGHHTEFQGQFTYDVTGTTLAGGTLTGVRDVSGTDLNFAVGDLNLPVSTVLGWAASGTSAEEVRGAIMAGNDLLLGSDFNDTLRGYAGNDTINGAGGDDLLDGGTGVNVIDGGAGNDTVERHAALGGSGAIAYDGSVYVVDGGGYDRLRDVEFIRYTDQTVASASAPVFDPLSYLAANTDLAAAFGTNSDAALSHYLNTGWSEGRSLRFNAAGYLADNPDLVAAFGTDTAQATRHYIETGRLEGRQTAFDSMSYLAANPDLIAAFGADTTAAALHYAEFGRQEGRSLVFDAQSYLARYPDLQAAFGNDLQAATTHYVTHGYEEGRSAAPLSTGLGTASMAFDGTQHAALSIGD
ncbi:hypothetical protein [Azospirillum sp. TSO35-2]|uniref:calcium-binding protein n=1 Tax=Azospirillum sp. TSO35-2 TaxID=716796 RepID=UPI000D649C99|nr:hypothetical protein [Azospirillum sp. TSO35-2]